MIVDTVKTIIHRTTMVSVQMLKDKRFKTGEPLLKTLVVLVTLATFTGCSHVGYYSQIVSGHMRIVMGKKPLAAVADDESVDERTRHKLKLAQRAREYAITEFSLPDNKSYTSFYDTKKNHVTWNVVAAGEFSFRPKTWCFPIAGCVSYRGYYDSEDAKAYAQSLSEEGFDAVVNGATAYSTLGWFADPLLNTMLNRSDPAVVSLLFHELAHQQLYVLNDSKFNESFASFVEQEGLARWNEEFGAAEQLPQLQNRRIRQEQFLELLRSTRNSLQDLYASDLEQSVMRQQKAQRFAELRDKYETLKQSWDGYRGYDGWFARELNNARLVSVATYNDYVPAFEVLFEQSKRDFPTFFANVQVLAELPLSQRSEKMQELLEAAGGNSQSL